MNLFEIFISILINIVSSFIFYQIFEKHKKSKKNINIVSNFNYNKKYISDIKKQFYICFSLVSGVIIWSLILTDKNFIDTFKLVVVFWLLLFTLFSFICLSDVVAKLEDEITNETSQNAIEKNKENI